VCGFDGESRFPVKGRFRYQNRVFFKLPFTLAPTVSDGQSSFEVVYYLKVRHSSTSPPNH
jgi:hypothetical protein